jgi:hypothetical protein
MNYKYDNWSAPASIERMPPRGFYFRVRRSVIPKRIHILIKFGYGQVWESGLVIVLPGWRAFEFRPWIRIVTPTKETTQCLIP